MMLESPTLHRSMPVTGLAVGADGRRQVVRSDSAFGPNLLKNALEVTVRILQGLERIALPGGPRPAAVLKQGPVSDSYNRSLVGPLLREFSRIIEIAFKPASIVAAKARPDHEEVRRYQDIDEVQLQHADGMERTAKMSDVRRRFGAWAVKPLRCKGHSAGLRGGNVGSANCQRANTPGRVRMAIV